HAPPPAGHAQWRHVDSFEAVTDQSFAAHPTRRNSGGPGFARALHFRLPPHDGMDSPPLATIRL
ncbi:hypothetical protein ACQ1ZK_16790, partial [Enterococcus faecium]